MCVVPRTRNTYYDRCFAGPRVWNSMPDELQQCDSLKQFKQHLDSFFSVMGPRRFVTFVK